MCWTAELCWAGGHWHQLEVQSGNPNHNIKKLLKGREKNTTQKQNEKQPSKKKNHKSSSTAWFILSFCMRLLEFNALRVASSISLLWRGCLLLYKAYLFLTGVKILTKAHCWQPNALYHQACDKTSWVISAGVYVLSHLAVAVTRLSVAQLSIHITQTWLLSYLALFQPQQTNTLPNNSSSALFALTSRFSSFGKTKGRTLCGPTASQVVSV